MKLATSPHASSIHKLGKELENSLHLEITAYRSLTLKYYCESWPVSGKDLWTSHETSVSCFLIEARVQLQHLRLSEHCSWQQAAANDEYSLYSY